MLKKFLRKIFAPAEEGLVPEKYFRVTIAPESIQCDDPKGNSNVISREDLLRVVIQTNDSGPWGIDFWWILEGSKAIVHVPQGATGEDELVDLLQALPDFNNEEMAKAMCCATNAEFLCWQKGA